MNYSSVYGFNVTDRIRKGECVLLADLETLTIDRADEVTAKRLVEAIDDETGRYKFYVKEDEHEQHNESSKNPAKACVDAHISGASEC